MIIGVPKETFPEERRVALTPDVIPALGKLGFEVLIEAGSGLNAGLSDEAYRGQGVRIIAARSELFGLSDIIIQVRGLGANSDAGRADLELFRSGHVLVALLDPLSSPKAGKELAEAGVTAFALELMPRITRAQNMDVLSSMATISGYRAVLLAAEALPKMFPMMMTAAGTITPANVFVVGAGVAGLQAIATARRLGAVVRAYDVRPAAKEQVESLGASFEVLPLETGDAEDAGGYAKAMDESFYRRQRQMMTAVVAESDVVITTAAVPAGKAPILVTDEMVAAMPSGSVIVDLAAERGGNCQLTEPGKTVTRQGVTIIAPINAAAGAPYHASRLYAKNCSNFISHMTRDGRLEIDREDPIVQETLLTHQGRIVHERVRELLKPAGAEERRVA